MTDYSKTVDFAAKDALASGNPAKTAKGTEINTELVNIQTAISTKFDAGDTGLFAAGTAGAPGVSFSTDPDNGMYLGGANQLAFASGGTARLFVDATALYVRQAIYAADGSAAVPGYSWENDPDSGFFRGTSDQIGITLGGVSAGQIAQGSFTITYTGFTVNPTGTATWQLIGKQVTILLPVLTATSNAVSFTATGIPAIIRPTTVQQVPMTNAINNGSTVGGACAQIDPGGTYTFFIAGGVAWVNTGVKGFSAAQVISYLTA